MGVTGGGPLLRRTRRRYYLGRFGIGDDPWSSQSLGPLRDFGGRDLSRRQGDGPGGLGRFGLQSIRAIMVSAKPWPRVIWLTVHSGHFGIGEALAPHDLAYSPFRPLWYRRSLDLA